MAIKRRNSISKILLEENIKSLGVAEKVSNSRDIKKIHFAVQAL